MRLAIPRETLPGENRVPIIPDIAKKLCRLGADVDVESGMGDSAGFSDQDYIDAGASIVTDRAALFGSADVLLRIHKPSHDEIALMEWSVEPNRDDTSSNWTHRGIELLADIRRLTGKTCLCVCVRTYGRMSVDVFKTIHRRVVVLV